APAGGPRTPATPGDRAAGGGPQPGRPRHARGGSLPRPRRPSIFVHRAGRPPGAGRGTDGTVAHAGDRPRGSPHDVRRRTGAEAPSPPPGGPAPSGGIPRPRAAEWGEPRAGPPRRDRGHPDPSGGPTLAAGGRERARDQD